MKATSQSIPSGDATADHDGQFLLLLYAATLATRVLVGSVIYLGGYTTFFAGDASTYDHWGWGLARYWSGTLQNPGWVIDRIGETGKNGMYYWVGGLYYVLGHNQLAATLVQITLISVIPVLVYKISYGVFSDRQAARIAGCLAAAMPSMVIWSCSLLKDPIVILLLCVAVHYSVKLQRNPGVRYVLPAVAAAVLVYPFRGYVFYFILLAVVGSLLVARSGSSGNVTTYFVRVGGVLLIAVVFFALGFDTIVAQQLHLNILETINISRQDLAQSANSGFMSGTAIRTLGDAAAILPRGLAYLLFAPFPWQGGGTRFQLALPDMLLWYALFPFSLVGGAYAVARHARRASVIVLFTLQLTLFYAVFIGNVGTAHRHRTQVFVFYLILAGAGMSWTVKRWQRKSAEARPRFASGGRSVPGPPDSPVRLGPGNRPAVPRDRPDGSDPGHP